MNSPVRWRFWVEIALGSLSLALLVLTLITREWIEALFGVDPDRGSGALEWALVSALAVATAVLGLIARFEWSRPRTIMPKTR
jgi:hypothetical protein